MQFTPASEPDALWLTNEQLAGYLEKKADLGPGLAISDRMARELARRLRLAPEPR
jgi:hypothetical protein